MTDAASSNVPQANFESGDITATSNPLSRKYDLIYMAGVHSIFDECDNWVKNIAEALTPEGRAFIFGMFNSYGYDILVKARQSASEGPYESGWNNISKQTVQRHFANNNCDTAFIDWAVPIDIEHNSKDALRTWTTKLEDGSRITTNGTRVIHDFSCAVVSPRSE
jgi:trans-aconitate methyltransferase